VPPLSSSLSLQHKLAENWWLKRGLWAWAFLDVSVLYGWLAKRRLKAFATGQKRSQKLPVRTIVVGNVIAGGAGKTPVTIAVVDHLLSKGFKVGVVSRGYGRTSEQTAQVTATSNVADVGDEPLLIAQRTGAPVFVHTDRYRAGMALLQAHPDTEVIVCDDGLQHLQLARDVDIIVFDERGIGNGWCLPAGPLREPWPRAHSTAAHTIHIHTGTTRAAKLPGVHAPRKLADHAINAHGEKITLAELAQSQQPICAIAGIAKPQAFFAMLREAGLNLAHTDALPDHYDFHSYKPNECAGHALICTEKDALKLWNTAPHAWAVPLSVELDLAALTQAIQPMNSAAGEQPAGTD
jgi:tetraacyldisaccharide 4'-kinase